MKTIRELRETAGMTQFELAMKIGVSLVTISNWENGRYEPTARKLRELARLFAVSMDDIDFEIPKNSPPERTRHRPVRAPRGLASAGRRQREGIA